MRLKLISCEIFYREIRAAVARSPHAVDVEFLPKGLHDIGAEGMRGSLQAALDRVDGTRYDAVLYGYGLCGNGLAGLAARSLPVVVPRGHDCITLFLGGKERYADYFQNHPGVYFKTTGWIERGQDLQQLHQPSIQSITGMNRSYEELAAKYGEDNARYLYEELVNCRRNYQQLTFIEMGVEPDDRFERQTQEEAGRRGWKFEKVQGDLSLIQRLVDGQWDEREFLVVPPGWRVVARYDEGIIAAEPPLGAEPHR
ncbi:MAG: DUF1638 domain-containing protein [Acidobacteria bacterium]|nr:DUF1638 domain-containing protein [Acidobacteriota bacterium]